MSELEDPSLIDFPPPELAGEEGLVYVGGDLSVANLKSAYSQGIFPWPQEGYPMLWFCPPERGVLDFSEFHIPRRFQKSLRSCPYEITLNKAFPQVIKACSQEPRKNQQGTWILPEMLDAYIEFHRAGYVQCIEVWDKDQLIGGLYGVFINGIFSGESMFHRKDGASKIALYHTIEFLKSKGTTWMDIQMVTPVLEQFGGKYIPREEYLSRLEREK